MNKEEKEEKTGIVVEALSKTLYRVKLDVNGQIVRAHKSNKMKRNRVKIYPNDRIKVEMSYYDATKGIIPLQKIVRNQDHEKKIVH